MLIWKGQNHMKKFKIENNGVTFLSREGKYLPIDQINKSELLFLINELVDSDDFEMDEFDDNLIKNAAHKIIYKSIYNKFIELSENKDSFREQYNNLFEDALNKYKKDE